MITELQEKILKRLIDELPLSASQSVDLSDLDDVHLLVSATKELANSDYVIDASTMSGAAAILKDKGRGYFRQKLIEEFGYEFVEKIAIIEEDIKKTESLLKTPLKPNDVPQTRSFISDMVAIYGKDIQNMGQHLGVCAYPQSGDPKVYERYLKLLIQMLKKHIVDLKIKAKETKAAENKVEVNPIFNNNPTFNNNNTTTINIINISQVFEAIGQSTLTDDEQNILKGMIADIDLAVKDKKADKKTVWEKIKSALGWVVNKGVDVGLAATLVPYFAAILQGTI